MAESLPMVIAALVMAVAAAVLAWKKGLVWRGLQRLAEALPTIRAQIDHFRLAKLYQSLALMHGGGYTFVEALDICGRIGLGGRIDEAVRLAASDIQAGKTPSVAFQTVGLADLVAMRILAVGERSGSFKTVLVTIGQRHALEFETFIARASRVVEPALLLLVALSVGGIVVMMYMPVFDIAGSLGRGG
jgi:general secretion pathway protein F